MRKLIATGIIATSILISSCRPNSYFDEYIGVNLIENRGFDSGGWLLDYGKVTAFPYMNFVDASGDEPTMPNSGTSADAIPYRLEIVNLIPNGDFETTVPPAAPLGWTVVNTAALDSDGTDIINGNSLHFDIPDPSTDYIDFDFTNGATGLLDTAVADATYLLRFQFKVISNGTKDFEYRDASGTVPLSVNVTDYLEVQDMPAQYSETVNTEFALDTATSIFAIGNEDPSGNPEEGYLDNFRVTRSDLKHEINIQLPQQATSMTGGDALPLLPSSYEFSVYVKLDPTTTYSGTGSEVDNRFDPSGITLGIRTFKAGAINGVVVSSVDYDPSWLSWTKVSVTFDITETFTIPDDPADDVLELYIEPTSTGLGANSRDVGSIIIAEPSLELIPR